jgi:hypothetical protein
MPSKDVLLIFIITSHLEITLARPKATAAASPPIGAVWLALRMGRAPVKRPLTHLKISRAARVKTAENTRAVPALGISM